jgi:uncharacterized phage-associated protein
MATAKDVAEYFLSLGAANEEGEDLISPLKIQKLVYYAQGFHLAMFGKKLFSEDILAWTHGPVVRSLFDRYKKYGSNAIPVPEEINVSAFSHEQKELLDDVYKVYGQFSAWRLRQMTHMEPPWKNTARDEVISPELMKSYFKTQLV